MKTKNGGVIGWIKERRCADAAHDPGWFQGSAIFGRQQFAGYYVELARARNLGFEQSIDWATCQDCLRWWRRAEPRWVDAMPGELVTW